MFEIIEKEIYNIKFNYTKLENYYNFEKLDRDCFVILRILYETIMICDIQKRYLEKLLFTVFDSVGKLHQTVRKMNVFHLDFGRNL